MNANTYAVILAGGRGERFWPLSTSRRPKQLLALVGRRALLTDAVYRIRAIIPEKRILVITSADLHAAVCHLLPGLPKVNVIGEPCGRDTAAAITLAAALIKARNPNAVFCVLTADHVVGNAAVFRRTLKESFARAAAADVLVTIGLKPAFPSTGFGYIETGGRLAGPTKTVFYRVRRFVEKPNERIAARYVKTGRFYWNSGMFIWSLSAWERALRRHCPPLARLLDTLTPLAGRVGFYAALKRAYAGLEKISVDYAVMERADNIVMVEGAFPWDDVGSWSALEQHFPKDGHGNVVVGNGELMESSGNIVVADNGLVALVGVDNMVVVKAGAVTLVCRKDRSQEVKRMVEKLRRRRDAHPWL
ncbi:MAG: NTP transferase domain-containing protein [Verrucomicrobia bacterium]|nr:NTP transferase domain-containing protein [Verrucomicrobiota bacterium]MBU1736464.1 NTP transferase domain-containing protein [Verrucomicrobiota bacterium]MBU1857231.1 NTP transferase domain-containing protein [Verrucomicrobiota bacterium]